MRRFSVILVLNIFYIFYNVYKDDIFTGGKNAGGVNHKDILQYNTASQTWEEFGQMKEARSEHAVALLEDVSQFCTTSGY